MSLDRIFFALALMGLGALSLVFGDFALQWQPVPAGVPAREVLAYASGALLLLGGAAMLWSRTATRASAVMFVYVALWSLLKLPAVVTGPLLEYNWLGWGELVMIAVGGWTLFARDHAADTRWTVLTDARAMRVARIAFGLACIPVGLSHFFYAEPTLGFVPTWLPFRSFWANLGGAGHVAAGLGLTFGIVPRLAAMMEAAMIGAFTALVWVPLVIREPTSQLQWTGFFVSWLIGAAAWVVGASLPRGAGTSDPAVKAPDVAIGMGSGTPARR